MSYIAYRLLLTPWRAVREYRALRVSRRFEVRGITVLDYEIFDNNSEIVSKIEKALDVIHHLDPRRFARLRRDLERILIARDTPAQFWALTGTCALKLDDVQRRSTATIALMIIHEAIHARLNRAGFFPWRSLRVRIERRCLLEERSFAARLHEHGYTDIARLIEWIDSRIVIRGASARHPTGSDHRSAE